MNSILNAAFIGCGAVAQKKHLPLSYADPNIHIKALFDSNRDTACRCKEEFGAEDTQIMNDAEEIFARGDIDLVFIATPNNTHATYSIRALNSGKHVICEKPMALNSTEAEAMLEASVQNSRMLHISYQNRFTIQAQYVKRLFDEGFFSEIYYAKAFALRRRAVPTWGVSTSKVFQGGGPLIDIGSHSLDLAMWLSDNFEPAYAVGTTYNKIAKRGSEANLWGNWDTNNYDAEDCALGFVVMKNGMTLTADAAYALNVAEECEASVDLFGVAGGVRLREQNGVTLIHEVGGRICMTENELQESFRSLTPKDHTLSASEREHKSFMKLLLDGQTYDPAAEQALAVARIVEGIYRAAETKQPFYF